MYANAQRQIFVMFGVISAMHGTPAPLRPGIVTLKTVPENYIHNEVLVLARARFLPPLLPLGLVL